MPCVPPGIEVVDLKMRRGIPSPAAVVRLVRLMHRLRPVVIQTWLYHADFLGLLAARLAGRAPVVWTVRCSDMDLSRYGRLTRLVVRALARLSFLPDVVAVNAEAGRLWHERLGYRPRAWEYLPNGIDTGSFRPDDPARRAWRERLGLGRETVLVGMAARRDPMKDHAGFLDAAARLTGDVAFVLVGTGVDASDPELARLAGAVAKPVHLLGPCMDIPGFFAGLDVAVLVSFSEGFPNVVAEAMACGVPVVATDVGAVAEIIGDTGRIVPPGNPHALALVLTDVVAATPEERRRLGALARARILRHYALPTATERYHALWAQLAGQEERILEKDTPPLP
ncbi:MAG: group 1 glycosyl transferase [Rhodospirillaceae bacterium]|nr:MAG: group 1 glycosyl transferase [Rhodospirillaceae bacterium]